MNINDAKNITTQGDAQEFAIEWQRWSCEQIMSFSDLSEWCHVFEKLAKEFNLVDEFVENGIIGRDVELTDLQIERQDFVDTRIFEMLKDVLGREIDWDIEPISEIRDIIINYYVINSDEEEMDFYPFIPME